MTQIMDACLHARAINDCRQTQTVLHAESAAAAAAAEAADAVPSLVVVYQGILQDYLRKWRCCR